MKKCENVTSAYIYSDNDGEDLVKYVEIFSYFTLK